MANHRAHEPSSLDLLRLSRVSCSHPESNSPCTLLFLSLVSDKLSHLGPYQHPNVDKPNLRSPGPISVSSLLPNQPQLRPKHRCRLFRRHTRPAFTLFHPCRHRTFNILHRRHESHFDSPIRASKSLLLHLHLPVL